MKNNNKALTLFDTMLPWDRVPGERRRNWIILGILLFICLLLIIVVENTVIPKKDHRVAEKIPERIARMVQEQRQREEPPPPPPIPQATVEVPVEEKPAGPAVDDKPEVKAPPTTEQVERAREVARKEVSVFQDALGGLPSVGATTRANTPGGGGLRTTGAQETRLERNLITSRAGSTSGGIVTSSASSAGGGGTGQPGGGLGGGVGGSGGGLAQVDSGIGAGGGGTGETRRTADGKSRRTDEQIRRVFDQNGGRIASAYQRALRGNPALSGSVVLSLVIEPDGKVSEVKIKSTQLDDDDLMRRLLALVRSMDFGALNVEVWRNDYVLNLFPDR